MEVRCVALAADESTADEYRLGTLVREAERC